MGVHSHDNVIEEFDLEKLSCSDKVLGCSDIRVGGSGISRGMVVRDDDGMCTGDNCCAEHFPSMDDNGVEYPHPHKVVSRHPSPGVEMDCDKALHVGIEVGVADDVFAPVRSDGPWIVA